MNIDTRKEVSDYELTEMYEQMLDECYPDVEIAGMHYSTSRALKEVDPIAFNCGEADYISSILGDQIEEVYYFSELTEKYKTNAVSNYIELEANENLTDREAVLVLEQNNEILFKYDGEIF